MKDWDQRATPENRRLLNERALAAEANARILIHPEVFVPTLEVFSDGQGIVIRAVVHSPKEYQIIREIVHQAVDPHPIRYELHYRK
jgi:hypothetical protein